MARNKHIEITRHLKENILARRYDGWLPPVRTLVKEFDTSVRTMTKAIKPLTASGLVRPTSSGTQICLDPFDDNDNGKRLGVVNIVQTSGPLAPGDTFIKTLRHLAAKDGFRSVVMDIADDALFNDVAFWRAQRVDGHIFVYSSFYSLLSRQLALHNIPFVVANWIPLNYGVHCVDFNTEQVYYSLAEQIIARTGSHRVTLTAPARVEPQRRWLRERWRAIAEHFGLPDYPGAGACYARDLEATARGWLATDDPPDYVICTHREANVLADAYAAAGRPLQLVLPRGIGEDMAAAWRYPKADYDVLARTAWSIFTRVLDGTAGPPRSHLIDCDIVLTTP